MKAIQVKEYVRVRLFLPLACICVLRAGPGSIFVDSSSPRCVKPGVQELYELTAN